MIILEQSGWYDENESYSYLVLKKDEKQIWQSNWWEPQELWEDRENFYLYLRREVEAAMKKYNIQIDISSDDYQEWKVIE